MLRPYRAALVTGLVVAGGLCMAPPAIAGGGYGGTTCADMPTPVCDLGAGKDGSSSNGPAAKPSDSAKAAPDSGKPSKGSGHAVPFNTVPGDGSRCSYIKSDYRPPAGGVITATYDRPLKPKPTVFPQVVSAALSTSTDMQAPEPPGAWYVWKCTGPADSDAVHRPPVWIPDGQQSGAAPLPSPDEMAARARKQLRFPTPGIAVNPVGEQLVNLPTWLWLSSGWDPVSATASVPGVAVTATATPTSVTWSMGDGNTITCTGAGTPFTPGTDPKAPSPDCGHTYRTSSAGQTSQAFPVTATVHWTVTWSGAGVGGTFPDMTTAGTASFRVAESQALNDGGG